MDTVAGFEAQCDWRFADKDSQFKELFAFGKKQKCGVGHNIIEEKTVQDQKGGTAMTTIGRLTTFVIESGCDLTGLGRCSWQLVGKGETCTRVVVAYQPSDPGSNSKGFTVWD